MSSEEKKLVCDRYYVDVHGRQKVSTDVIAPGTYARPWPAAEDQNDDLWIREWCEAYSPYFHPFVRSQKPTDDDDWMTNLQLKLCPLTSSVRVGCTLNLSHIADHVQRAKPDGIALLRPRRRKENKLTITLQFQTKYIRAYLPAPITLFPQGEVRVEKMSSEYASVAALRAAILFLWTIGYPVRFHNFQFLDFEAHCKLPFPKVDLMELRASCLDGLLLPIPEYLSPAEKRKRQRASEWLRQADALPLYDQIPPPVIFSLQDFDFANWPAIVRRGEGPGKACTASCCATPPNSIRVPVDVEIGWKTTCHVSGATCREEALGAIRASHRLWSHAIVTELSAAGAAGPASAPAAADGRPKKSARLK